MDPLTPAEIAQICTSFLLSSPPGEFSEVTTDVRALVNDDALLNQHFGSTAQEYNTDQYEIVTAADGHKVLLTKIGEVGPTQYLDPKAGATITVDHVEKTVVSSAAGGTNSALESYRASIETAMEEYVNDHYPEGACTVYGGDNNVTICISAAKFSPGNFWNGRWRSTWVVSMTSGATQATLDGTYKLAVHYYEDGNVQLNTESSVQGDAQFGGAADCGAAVAKAIERAENAYQTGIEESYKLMGERTFKTLRRKLPVTRHPMDWDKAVGYRLGRELTAA